MLVGHPEALRITIGIVIFYLVTGPRLTCPPGDGEKPFPGHFPYPESGSSFAIGTLFSNRRIY